MQALLVDQSGIDRADDVLRLITDCDNVGSGIDRFRNALLHRQVLDTPCHTLQDAGVRIDIALKSELVPQQIRNNRLIERHTDLLKRLVDRRMRRNGFLLARDRVIRHHGCRTCIDRGLEAGDMILLQAAGRAVYIVLALSVMRVKTVLTGTAAGEMLRRHGDTVFAQLISLMRLDQLCNDLRDILRILAESLMCTEPARICRAVCHIHITLADIAGLEVDVALRCKIRYGLRIALSCRGNAEVLRIHRISVRICALIPDNRAVIVAGVRHDDRGDAETCTFAHFLERVRPLRHVLGIFHLTDDVMAQLLLLDHIRRALRKARRAAGHKRNLAGFLADQAVMACFFFVFNRNTHPGLRDQEHSCFLLDRHAADQILSAFFRRQTPVLVRLQFAVAVQILELKAIDFDDLFDTCFDFLLTHLNPPYLRILIQLISVYHIISSK